MKSAVNKLILLGCIIIFNCGCSSSSGKEENYKPLEMVENKISPVKVQTSLSQFRKFEYLVQSNGKIKALREQQWFSESEGILVFFNGLNGKKYAAGNTIAQFDTTLITLKLNRARAVIYNAQLEYQSQLLGYDNLLRGKTTEETETIKKKLKISSGLVAAEQDSAELNYELKKSRVAAPFDGELADIKIQQGQHIKNGQELFKLYSANALVLEIKVMESDLGFLQINQPAEIRPLSDKQLVYSGTIMEINPYVDESGFVLVKLLIHQLPKHTNKPLTPLFPGMNCNATIRILMNNTVVVPKEAIVMRDGRAIVFTVEDSLAKWNYVKLGRDNGKEQEILQGLKPGKKIVVNNNLQLANNSIIEEGATL